jgi:hypothetical protein
MRLSFREEEIKVTSTVRHEETGWSFKDRMHNVIDLQETVPL